jgi:hypothetical protein
MEGRCVINNYAPGEITNIDSCTIAKNINVVPDLIKRFALSTTVSRSLLQPLQTENRSGDALVRVFSSCLFLARACSMATIMSVDLMLALTCSVLARSCNISQIRAMREARMTRFEAMKENGLTLPQTSQCSRLHRGLTSSSTLSPSSPQTLSILSASTWSSVLDSRFRSCVLL